MIEVSVWMVDGTILHVVTKESQYADLFVGKDATLIRRAEPSKDALVRLIGIALKQDREVKMIPPSTKNGQWTYELQDSTKERVVIL